MAEIERQSLGKPSISDPHEQELNAGRKRASTSQEPASKRRRRSEDEKNEQLRENESLTYKKPRNRKSKAQIRTSEPEAHFDTQANSSRPRHVRFGSEDIEMPESAAPGDLETDMAEEDEEDSSDDDDAPEDVTANAAHATSVAAQRQAARAVEQQQANARKKRQEREKRLQEQAKTSGKPKRSKPVDLPDLLPEDILADEPFARPPTPPPEASRPKLSSDLSKTKSIKFEDKKPKDIQVGPVRVSVLQKQNKLLPPRANGRAKSVKEQWLAGRQGSSVQRQSVGKGFIRH